MSGRSEGRKKGAPGSGSGEGDTSAHQADNAVRRQRMTSGGGRKGRGRPRTTGFQQTSQAFTGLGARPGSWCWREPLG